MDELSIRLSEVMAGCLVGNIRVTHLYGIPMICVTFSQVWMVYITRVVECVQSLHRRTLYG